MFCATHHDPVLWPEPARFRPARPLDAKPTPYALTPFGGGVRRCIGAALAQHELEVVLRDVLAAATLQPGGPPEHVRLNGITLVPSRGGRVRLRARP
jgi:cytochrome P450